MQLPIYLTLLNKAEETLSNGFRIVSDGHDRDGDVHYACAGFAGGCAANAALLAPFLSREATGPAPERLHPPGLSATRSGPMGLLRDLQDLHQMASFVELTWVLVGQAAAGARDRELQAVVAAALPVTQAQVAWLVMRMKSEAPQALLIGGRDPTR